MKKLRIKRYGRHSNSAKSIRNAIEDSKLIKRVNSTYIHRPNHWVLNWGCSNSTPYPMFNSPEFVSTAVNKLRTLQELTPSFTVPWTTEREEASQWPNLVICRTNLVGSGGDGIIVHDNCSDDEIPEAPLYTQYIEPLREIRVHVWRNKVIDLQFKAHRGGDDLDHIIRNHNNGWIYVRQNRFVDDQTIENAKGSAIWVVESLSGDFAAVDMIIDRENHVYILELNTAPGLVNTTLDKYVEQIKLELAA